MPLRIVMMGAGTFALPAFETLCDSPHQVVALVTQPDRTGSGGRRHPHPMKEAALARAIDVFQPARASAPESLDRLRDFQADLYVVAAYGQILSQKLLDIPRLGAINIHASILPRWRGAAPIHYALLNGDAETGVTLFQIVRELDAGPILGIVRTPIGPTETSGDVERRLADLASPLTQQVIAELEAGSAHPQTQNESQVTLAPKMTKSFGEIDWTRTSREIDLHIRAMQPWPMPFTTLHAADGGALRLIVLGVAPDDASPVTFTETAGTGRCAPAGTVVDSSRNHLHVATGDGVVRILRLQPTGKRAMDCDEFLRGRSVPPGSHFGPESPTP